MLTDKIENAGAQARSSSILDLDLPESGATGDMSLPRFDFSFDFDLEETAPSNAANTTPAPAPVAPAPVPAAASPPHCTWANFYVGWMKSLENGLYRTERPGRRYSISANRYLRG